MNPIEEKDRAEGEDKEEEKSQKEEPGKIEGETLHLGGNDSSLLEGKNDEEEEKSNPDKEENENKEGLKFEENKNESFRSGDTDKENQEDNQKAQGTEPKNAEEGRTREKTFKNVTLLYDYKLNQISLDEEINRTYKKFWDLLPHTFEGEISKSTFLSLFSKILKILLPLVNYSDIDKFSEGVWLKYTKNKNTMSRETFDKVIFRVTHFVSVHVNEGEYLDTLNLIYGRITRIRKYCASGEEKVFYPSIKVSLIKSITKEEYDATTWQVFGSRENIHPQLFEEFDQGDPNAGDQEDKNEEGGNKANQEGTPKNKNQVNNTEGSQEKSMEMKVCKARPRLKIIDDFINPKNNLDEIQVLNNIGEKKEDKNIRNKNLYSYYYVDKNFYLYNEEIFFLDQEEIESVKSEINSHLKYELLDDNELVIYGYPTQFILNKFINNLKELEETNITPNSNYDSTFYITDYQPYEKQKIFLKIHNKDQLLTFLKENSSFILIRDAFAINQNLNLGEDLNESYLNIVTNLKRNLAMDRYFDVYEIKLPDGSKTKANLDHLIMNSTYRKAFGNVFDAKSNKIGVKSKLWEEKIENKIETIVKTKFQNIHVKLLNLNLSYDFFEPNIESIQDDKAKIEATIIQETEQNLNFFDKFKSKERIRTENFDNENDLYDEVNKKSPIIFVIGPPRIGKSSVCKKLADDLGMVYLEPTKFFDSIFKKVADFEEKMLTWDEEHPKEEEPNPEENQEEQPAEAEDAKAKKAKKVKKEEVNYLASWEPEPQKNVKPEVDSVLNEVELAVYNDLINGQGVSELNMQRMYMYMLHSDLAASRGVVIDMNSNITPKTDNPNNDSRSFAEKILTGFYGEVEVDYVVELKMNKDELVLRNNNMRLNLKTMTSISPRDIELMKKPKVNKKEILEDEIEYDEEGKPIVPEPEPEPELGEEELEKIPKDVDLLEITNNEELFNQQYEYYEDVQKPKVMEYVEKLKTNYYIPVDISGLDFDDVAELIKCKLDFANPLRPIAKALDSADFKGLLQDGREGVLPYRKWSQWKQIDPVALKDEFLVLTGSTEFPAVYFSRVFLFVSEDNRKKFLENPKKYISCPPQVPVNYRVSIIGPSKSGKSLIAQMLSDIYGWRIMDMEEIYEKVKEYQKTWTEPELNSVYTRRVHFSANEFKEVIVNMSKKPSERKPDNFVSKIVFMLDSMGIPLDKKKTKEQFFAFRKYHRSKLDHMFSRMKEAKEREDFERKEEEIRVAEEKEEQKRLEDESKEEETFFSEMTECARSLYEVEKDKRAQKYIDHVAQKDKEKEQRAKDLEEKEKRNPYPPEEDYVIEDLRSDQFFLAFDEKGEHPRVSGIILINHPFNDEECEKLKDFNIVMDRIIYLKDDSEEGIKVLTERRIPNFNSLKEEKQGEELEKTKAETAKYDEVIGILKEKYNVNNEESVIEVGYNEPLEELRLKLENALNPFNIKIDQEDKVVLPGDINQEEKYPLSKGPFGLFCPVIYKEDNWLFYAPEANEVQVNQKVYRISGEKEMEKFRNNPAKYLGPNGSLMPIDIPPPHIMITGYQGSGVTFYSNVLSKQFRLIKREIQNDFMKIWEKQRLERKEKRVQKKREELMKQNEEIEQKNAETKKENPEAEPEPLINIDDVIKEDAALDEEGEDYNAVDNDKAIFKSLFNPLSPTVYDASWNGLEEKVSTPFIDLLTDSRRVPNVMVVFKVNLKSIMDRLFNMEEIEQKFQKMYKESQDKRKQKEDELIKQKKQEKFDELKQQFEEEQANQENNKEAEQANPEGEKPEGEDGEPPKPKLKMPVLEEIQIELTPEEKEDIWNSPDPDLIEKDALIQQEKEKLSQRYEANVGTIQTLIDTLKERGVPVIEINNDTTRENVYTNLLLELSPYIYNRKNLIEKQLVYNKEFQPVLSLRKVRDLYTNSEVYLPSVYGKLSPVEPSKLCIRTDYPIVYRDRVYLFNDPEEKKKFQEYPLDYRTGLESPKDAYPMKGRTIIFTIGNPCSGKTTLANLLSQYMGYQKVTVDSAILDLLKMLKNCDLLDTIKKTIYEGKATSDDLIMKIINRRITMKDLVNENIVIDGFPYTLSLSVSLSDYLKPDLVFVAECDTSTRMKRCLSQKDFDGIPEVVNERNAQLEGHFLDIMENFKESQYDIRYFDMTKSRWYIKDQILDLLQGRKKSEMAFSRNLSLDKPCLLSGFTPCKLLKRIEEYSILKCPLLMYSPISLKTSSLFKDAICIDNSWNNYIVYTPYDAIKEQKEEEERKLEEAKEKEKNKKKEKEPTQPDEANNNNPKEEQQNITHTGTNEKLENTEGNQEPKSSQPEEPEHTQTNNNNQTEPKENEEKKETENKEENAENKGENNIDNNEQNREGDKKGTGVTNQKSIHHFDSEPTPLPTATALATDPSSYRFKNLERNPRYTQFHFLTKEDEVNQFIKSPSEYKSYLLEIRKDIKPPEILSVEKISEILYEDEKEEVAENEEGSEEHNSGEGDSESVAQKEDLGVKLSLNVKFEYQDCCPISIVEDRMMRIGKVFYSIKYNGKYYKFLSMENMLKFKQDPNKYTNLTLPVRKVNQESNTISEKEIMFNNTVNFLEFTFGSLITKGMLELSNNRIKYPYLNVKESSLKYLALFLKANNPNNNDYAKQKYKKILKDFIKNSKLPLELFSVFEKYKNEKADLLNKKLIRKQLDTVSVKYDKLMEKAKIQNNTRFANFFKIENQNEDENN